MVRSISVFHVNFDFDSIRIAHLRWILVIFEQTQPWLLFLLDFGLQLAGEDSGLIWRLRVSLSLMVAIDCPKDISLI